MIPTKSDIRVDSNMDGVKVDMKFDENSLAHIMSVLTDLYSDPEMAVIREYSTNALDSHTEAGNSAPIEISLPGSLSPYFRVKDYGVGMSVSDIESIYSKYGASTKRQTDTQVGMLGLGCKSALTYVNQFTVTAVKGGVKTQVSVGRNEDGTGTMEIVDTVSTHEPNGVEITIPVKNASTFNSKAQKFFKFWDTDKVLINGQKPVPYDFMKVSEGIFLNPGDDTNDYIVMGNVAYTVDPKNPLSSGRGTWSRSYGVTAYVGIGDVHFTPAREALHYTSKTLTTISRISADFDANLTAAIDKAINEAPTHAKALIMRQEWNRRLGRTLSNSYKGTKFPDSLPFGSGIIYYPSRSRGGSYGANSVSAIEVQTALVITNYPSASLTSNNKAKARQWADSNNVTAKFYLFTDKMFGSPWTDDVTTVDWDTVKKETLTPSSSGRGGYSTKAIKGSFNVWDARGIWIEKDDLKTTDDIVYVTGAYRAEYHACAFITSQSPQTRIVAVPGNRLAKFLRELPNARTIDSVLNPLIQATKDALTDDDKRCLGVDSYAYSRISGLDVSKIDDPRFAEFSRITLLANNGSTTRAAWHESRRFLGRTGISANVKTIPVVDPTGDYPLLTQITSTGYGLSRTNKEHLYLYLNAAYAAKKGS